MKDQRNKLVTSCCPAVWGEIYGKIDNQKDLAEFVDKKVDEVLDEKEILTSDNVKTINGESIVGEGDIEITGSLTPEQEEKLNKIDDKADKSWVEGQGYLTEHQSLKTINGQSVVGNGNITIEGGVTEEWVNQAIDDKTMGMVTEDALDTKLEDYPSKSWVEEQGYLTEHQHLKTVNGQTIVGDGNIEIEGGLTPEQEEKLNEIDNKVSVGDFEAYKSQVTTALGKKASTDSVAKKADKTWVEAKGYLTEHQHLKTINGEEIVGYGNIEIQGGEGGNGDYKIYHNEDMPGEEGKMGYVITDNYREEDIDESSTGEGYYGYYIEYPDDMGNFFNFEITNIELPENKLVIFPDRADDKIHVRFTYNSEVVYDESHDYSAVEVNEGDFSFKLILNPYNAEIHELTWQGQYRISDRSELDSVRGYAYDGQTGELRINGPGGQTLKDYLGVGDIDYRTSLLKYDVEETGVLSRKLNVEGGGFVIKNIKIDGAECPPSWVEKNFFAARNELYFMYISNIYRVSRDFDFELVATFPDLIMFEPSENCWSDRDGRIYYNDYELNLDEGTYSALHNPGNHHTGGGYDQSYFTTTDFGTFNFHPEGGGSNPHYIFDEETQTFSPLEVNGDEVPFKFNRYMVPFNPNEYYYLREGQVVKFEPEEVRFTIISEAECPFPTRINGEFISGERLFDDCLHSKMGNLYYIKDLNNLYKLTDGKWMKLEFVPSGIYTYDVRTKYRGIIYDGRAMNFTDSYPNYYIDVYPSMWISNEWRSLADVDNNILLGNKENTITKPQIFKGGRYAYMIDPDEGTFRDIYNYNRIELSPETGTKIAANKGIELNSSNVTINGKRALTEDDRMFMSKVPTPVGDQCNFDTYPPYTPEGIYLDYEGRMRFDGTKKSYVYKNGAWTNVTYGGNNTPYGSTFRAPDGTICKVKNSYPWTLDRETGVWVEHSDVTLGFSASEDGIFTTHDGRVFYCCCGYDVELVPAENSWGYTFTPASFTNGKAGGYVCHSDDRTMCFEYGYVYELHDMEWVPISYPSIECQEHEQPFVANNNFYTKSENKYYKFDFEKNDWVYVSDVAAEFDGDTGGKKNQRHFSDGNQVYVWGGYKKCGYIYGYEYVPLEEPELDGEYTLEAYRHDDRNEYRWKESITMTDIDSAVENKLNEVIWSGTKAQWDALSESERVSYKIALIR